MNRFIKVGLCFAVFCVIIGFGYHFYSQHKKMVEYKKLFDDCDITCKNMSAGEIQNIRLGIKSDVKNLKENIGRPISDEQLGSIKKAKEYDIYMPDGYWRELCTCNCDVEAKNQTGFFDPKTESEIDIVAAQADKSEYYFNCIQNVKNKYFKTASEKKKEADRERDGI